MKKSLFLTVIVGLALLFASCSKSNMTSTPEVATVPQNENASLSDILKAGPWVIDYYVDEEDKSADFTGYVFTFNSDGGLTLKKGNESYTGQWQALKEDGVTKLCININTINIVQKLNDKWQLKDLNSTKLEMRNDDSKHNEFLN